MRTDTAITLITDLVYKPGWVITATENKRFENAITVTFNYPAPNFDREMAPNYEMPAAPPDGPHASFALIVSPHADSTWVYRAITQFIMCIEEHEMREALRVKPTMWAPFHPHHDDGIIRWSHVTKTPVDVQYMRDLQFGIA